MPAKIAGTNKSEYTLKNNLIISEEEWEEIEDFLRGTLPAEAKERILQRINEDSEFSDKVTHVRLLTIGIREAALEADLEQISLTGEKAELPHIPGYRKKYYFGWVAAAAIVVFVIGLAYFNIFESKESKLFSEYYYPDSGLVSSMGVSDNYDFDVAMIDYKSGKYNQSVIAMKKLLHSNLNNDTLNYFIGNSFLAMGKTDSAISYLRVVAGNNRSAFAKDANWYIGLAYLKLKDQLKAASYISQSGNVKKDELLKRISK